MPWRVRNVCVIRPLFARRSCCRGVPVVTIPAHSNAAVFVHAGCSCAGCNCAPANTTLWQLQLGSANVMLIQLWSAYIIHRLMSLSHVPSNWKMQYLPCCAMSLMTRGHNGTEDIPVMASSCPVIAGLSDCNIALSCYPASGSH